MTRHVLIFTAYKEVLRQGTIFTCMSHSVHEDGGGGGGAWHGVHVW